MSLQLSQYNYGSFSYAPVDSLLSIDSPAILRTENFTICDVGQSAILECAVSIDNKDMNVWVNWTTSKNERVNESHIMLRRGNSFYLDSYIPCYGWILYLSGVLHVFS